MLITQNIRDLAICVMAFALWGWLGAGCAFVLLFVLNLVDYQMQRAVLAKLKRLEDAIKWHEGAP